MKNALNRETLTLEAAKEAAAIIKGGYDHYRNVHILERAILEAYSFKTGANLQNLKRSARAIRLNADITWRAVFYCSLLTQIIGEKISPQLYDEVCNDLILINNSGDFKRVAGMEKIRVKGEEYVVLSKGRTDWYLIKMGDPYWYGCIHLYEYYLPKNIVRAIAHVPTSMVKGF